MLSSKKPIFQERDLCCLRTLTPDNVDALHFVPIFNSEFLVRPAIKFTIIVTDEFMVCFEQEFARLWLL